MRASLSIWAAFIGCCGQAWAEAPKMVFIAPINQDMPIAGYTNGVLTNGLLKDVGEVLSKRLGRRAEFLSLPSKRVPGALTQGQADALCYVLPAWIDGSFHWSQPLFRTAEVIVSQQGARPVNALSQLAKIPIGTVLGYRYPPIEQTLVSDFVRDDAPTMELLFAKLALGRTQYGIVDVLTLAYKQKTDATVQLRTDMTLTTSITQCAFSKLSKVPFAEVKRALDGLISDGTFDRLGTKYR